MSVVDFLDSNVLLYLFDSDTYKQQCAEELVRIGLENGTACISYQVVQEVMNVMGKIGISIAEIRTFLDQVLIPMWRINPNETFYRSGLEVQLRYGFSFYDSLVIAAALEAGCKTLHSEDLQHGQQIQGLTIQNPFRKE